MKIRYTANALQQLDEVLSYINERNSKGARRVGQRIHAVIDLLAQHPLAGQATERAGQRRIVATPYPYAIFYRAHDNQIVIQRIRHMARKPVQI